MKLSTRARYGLRICYLLGLNKEVTSLSELVNQTDLSKKYLEQLLGMLRRAGIVGTKRGKNGGYYLLRPASQITADEILTALDDNFEIADCVAGNCDDEYCPNKPLFIRLYKDIKKVLTSTTLQDFISDSFCKERDKYENTN
jgi:Rrf2 family protein